MEKKIIIDNSILNAGGGIQVAISFLKDLIQLDLKNQYYIIQSPNITIQLDTSIFPENFIFFDLEEDKHKNLFKRIKATKKIEDEVKPDCIFTIFGPSYHKSNFPKVVGFALPYIIYPNSPFFRQISFKEKIKYKLMNVVKTYCFNRNSDAIIFESDDARVIFKEKLTKEKNLYTVNNTLNQVFDNYQVKGTYRNQDVFNLLCLSANYPHKNLNLIPSVIEEIIAIRPKYKFKFNISANKSDFNFDDKYDEYINYLGRIELSKLPELYETMNVLFMPTLLEVFSTTYLEAMYMQIPIISSDMSFARDTCGEAALYCQPTNANDYAKKIITLSEDKILYENLVQKGINNLQRFGTSMYRTQAYLNIIKDTINANNKK